VAGDIMAQILVRCSETDRERIKTKAAAVKLSVSSFLLRKGLDDGRFRDTEDSTTLANVYAQLLELNQNLSSLTESESTQRAIQVCEDVGREVVLYRLARQVEKNS
jgi:hypothetical protein